MSRQRVLLLAAALERSCVASTRKFTQLHQDREKIHKQRQAQGCKSPIAVSVFQGGFFLQVTQNSIHSWFRCWNVILSGERYTCSNFMKRGLSCFKKWAGTNKPLDDKTQKYRNTGNSWLSVWSCEQLCFFFCLFFLKSIFLFSCIPLTPWFRQVVLLSHDRELTVSFCFTING